MKIIKFFFKCSLLIVSVLWIFSCNSNDPNEAASADAEKNATVSCTLTCAGEVSLALNSHTLDPSDARNERALFNSEVSTTATVIDTLIDSIPYTEFCVLKSKASGISSSCSTSSIITGIKMSLGLQSGLTKMKLIFEPVKLCLIGKDTVTATGSSGTFTYIAGTFSIVGTDEKKYFYDESGKKFQELHDTLVNNDTARYMRNVLIKHYATSSPESFTVHPTNDTLSDVKSVFFSFQEIMRLYEDNTGTNYIKIWNSLRDYSYVSLGTISIRKHSVFMGPASMNKLIRQEDKFIYPGGFDRAYANLAHLCPPNCLTLVFRLD